MGGGVPRRAALHRHAGVCLPPAPDAQRRARRRPRPRLRSEPCRVGRQPAVRRRRVGRDADDAPCARARHRRRRYDDARLGGAARADRLRPLPLRRAGTSPPSTASSQRTRPSSTRRRTPSGRRAPAEPSGASTRSRARRRATPTRSRATPSASPASPGRSGGSPCTSRAIPGTPSGRRTSSSAAGAGRGRASSTTPCPQPLHRPSRATGRSCGPDDELPPRRPGTLLASPSVLRPARSWTNKQSIESFANILLVLLWASLCGIWF